MKNLVAAMLGLALLMPVTAGAADPSADDLFKQVQTDSQGKSGAELEGVYAKALPALIAKPETDDVALQKIAFHASRPGADGERAALCKVLAARLTAEQATPVKVLLLRHLQRIGRDESVAAIVTALSDSDALVRESARRALANNPSRAAADSLKAEIDKASDAKWKAALVTALGYRRDAADAATFAKLAAAGDDVVKLPALLALGRTGDASAGAVLAAARQSGSDAAKKAATDAYLILADRLAAANQKDAALKIYTDLLGAGGVVRCAAIVGLGNTGAAAQAAQLLELLGDKDVQARGAALEALAKFQDPALTSQIVAQLAKADTSAKPWLLRALLARKEAKQHAKLFAQAATDADATVRLEAIKALASVGDGSSVAALVASASRKIDDKAANAITLKEEQAAARNTLEMMAGADVDQALLALLPGGETAARVEVIKAIGLRRSAGSVDPLFAAAVDADSSIRGEAFKALAIVADFKDIEKAVKLMVSPKEENDRNNIGTMLVAIARKNADADARIAPILAAAEKAEGATKAALLNAVGQIGGDKALAAIRTAIKSSDEKTHEAGVRALANWPDAAPLGDLLTLAKEEKNNTLSILALRGYIRILALPHQRKVDDSLKLYKDAMDAAKRPDEKKSVLGGVGQLKDPKALAFVQPYLSDPALAGEACAAAVTLGKDTADKNPKLTKEVMTKVLEISKNEGQKKTAKETLDKIAAKEKM